MSTYILFKKTLPHPSNPLLQVEFEAREELTDPAEHCDHDGVKWIINEQRKGNQASWFNARVSVRVIGTDVISKPEYLGCCSYSTFDSFMSEGGYFPDMIKEATENFYSGLDSEVQKIKSTLKMLEEVKRGIK